MRPWINQHSTRGDPRLECISFPPYLFEVERIIGLHQHPPEIEAFARTGFDMHTDEGPVEYEAVVDCVTRHLVTVNVEYA